MKIEPSEFLPIGNEFQKIFGISFGKFIDTSVRDNELYLKAL